ACGLLASRGAPEVGGDRAGHFGFLFEWLGPEGDALAHAGISDRARGGLCRPRQRHVAGMDVEVGPLRARERPFILVPLNELLAWMAHLQQHLGLLAPASVFPFEKMA